MRFIRFLASLVCLACALPLLAFVPKQEGPGDLLLIDPPRIAPPR